MIRICPDHVNPCIAPDQCIWVKILTAWINEIGGKKGIIIEFSELYPSLGKPAVAVLGIPGSEATLRN